MLEGDLVSQIRTKVTNAQIRRIEPEPASSLEATEPTSDVSASVAAKEEEPPEDEWQNAAGVW